MSSGRDDYALRVGLVLVAVTLAVIVFAVCPASAQPSGYYKYGKDVAKIQQRVYGISAWSSLLLAQIEQESGWRACVGSPAGARGLTQFIPSTERAVEAKYGVAGDICNVEHAALLQAYLMRDNARACGSVFVGFVPVWACALRTYNGSPRNFWREWVAAGKPTDSTLPLEVECRRFRRASHCYENTQYWRRIFDRWPKYAARWGR